MRSVTTSTSATRHRHFVLKRRMWYAQYQVIRRCCRQLRKDTVTWYVLHNPPVSQRNQTDTRPRAQDVEVPGGQHVYVAASGALAYTVPHSNIIPKGAHSRSFALDRTSGTSSSFTYSGTGKASGWLACPVSVAVYQVFANVELEDQNVPQKNVSACIALDALTTNYTLPGAAAWQYT